MYQSTLDIYCVDNVIWRYKKEGKQMTTEEAKVKKVNKEYDWDKSGCTCPDKKNRGGSYIFYNTQCCKHEYSEFTILFGSDTKKLQTQTNEILKANDELIKKVKTPFKERVEDNPFDLFNSGDPE